MPDNEPSLGVSNDGKDLFLLDMLEKYQEEFWFFTPNLRTGYNNLEKLIIQVTDNFVIKPLEFRELINRGTPEVLTTAAIIVGTHYSLGPARESCDISHLGQLCNNAFFALEVLIDVIGSYVGGYLNLKFENLECDLIQSKDKSVRYISFTDVKVRRGGCDYEGRQYKPMRIRHNLLNYVNNGKDESKNKIIKHLNLTEHIRRGIMLSSEPYEFPYIIKKKTKGNTYYYVGLIKADRDGKIELTALSDEKGMPNEKGKSKVYRKKYEAINEISEKLKIKYGNLRK